VRLLGFLINHRETCTSIRIAFFVTVKQSPSCERGWSPVLRSICPHPIEHPVSLQYIPEPKADTRTDPDESSPKPLYLLLILRLKCLSVLRSILSFNLSV
jgi:hypothetical protein